MPIKLRASDRTTIVVAVLIAAVSLALSVKYFSHAFPEAAIQFRVNRDDSRPLAEKFLAARGFKLEGYRHTAAFEYDDGAKTYLERTQGLERMNRLTRGPLHLWRWSHRWFMPQQKEEYRVDLVPSGEVVGFGHAIREEAPGASLEPASARARAETFLTQTMGRNLSDLEFVETQTEKRPARSDHYFTWKQKSVDLGEGSLRLEVEVDGDQVAAYQEFVKVPEQWARDYEKLRSHNDTAQIVDEVFWILLSLAMLVILIRRLRDRDVPVGLSRAFGGVAAALYFLGQLNSFSLAEFGYQTTDAYSSFVFSYLGGSLLAALGTGTVIFLLVAASEPVYREGYPQQLSLRKYFTWNGLRSRSFLLANIVGITLTFFFFAYQTVFYLAADKLGAWAPADVPFSDLLNTKFPWVTVLFIGFFPAVSEELQFRAFSIPFLKRLLRSGPLGLVLSAFIWGFLHAAYPNQPFFIRGLEVGLGGVIVGLVMLRFGILATLIWHYSVDALYTAFLLIRSPNHYLMASGAVSAGIMLVPLLVALVAYWRSGTFSEEEMLTNASQGISRAVREEVVKPEAPLDYQPLTQRRVCVGGVLTVIFVLLAAIPVYRFGRGFSVHITGAQAIRAADAYLRQQHVDPRSYHSVAWVHDNVDLLAVRYLLEHKTVKQTDQIYRMATRLAVFEVRYFRPLEKEEYHVFIDPESGQFFGALRSLDEDAPGASLTAEQAQAVAEKYLAQQGYRLSDFELQNSEAEKRKARQDYTLVWQAKPGDPRDVGEAHYRLEVDLAGDQVIGSRRSFKLPESWERARNSTTLVNTVLFYLGSLLGLALVAAGVVLLVLKIRAGQMPWRPAAYVGALLMVLMLLSALGQWPELDRQYVTSIPLAYWRIYEVVGLVVSPLVAGLLGWLLAGLVASLYPQGWLLLSRGARRIWRRDAALCCALAMAACFGLDNLAEAFAAHFHAIAPVGVGIVPGILNAVLPGGVMFLEGLERSLFLLCGLGLLIYVLQLGWSKKAWWLWALIPLALVGLGPANAHSWREFGAGWLMSIVPLAVEVAILIAFFRNNLLTYLCSAFCFTVAQSLISLCSQHAAFYRANGLLLGALVALFLGWLFWGGGEAEAGDRP